MTITKATGQSSLVAGSWHDVTLGHEGLTLLSKALAMDAAHGDAYAVVTPEQQVSILYAGAPFWGKKLADPQLDSLSYFQDELSVTAGNWLSQHGGRSATGGETVLPRQNRLFPVWCLPCAVKVSTRVAGKHPHSQGSVASSSARRRAPSAPRGGGRVFLGL